MAQVDVLHTHSIDLYCEPVIVKTEEEVYRDAAQRVLACELQNATALKFPPPPPIVWDGVDDTITPFRELPPLHSGPPMYHIEQGIKAEIEASASEEPDAERAFFVADLSNVYYQFRKWQACLPGIQPFYAIKCNPDPYVLRLLAGLGAGFDCASYGEISEVLSIGNIDPSRIIFANPCKALSFIRSSRRAGVDIMTFDNFDELVKISKTHPDAKLVLRILTDDSKSLCRLGLKFGASMDTVPALLTRARELGLNVVGISFHVGSGCYDPSAFADAIALAKQAFDFGAHAGYKFSLLDIGGGFEDKGFERTAAVVRSALLASFSPYLKDIKVIAEPGRFFVNGAYKLAASVIARRAGNKEDTLVSGPPAAAEEPHPEVMYYINEGVYGAFNCVLFDHQKIVPYSLTLAHRLTAPDQGQTNAQHRDLRPASLWGPTCDSIDCVCPVTFLPRSLEVGDWLGFDNMGAYTICAASQFNGFRKSSITYTSGVGNMSDLVRALLQISAGRG